MQTQKAIQKLIKNLKQNLNQLNLKEVKLTKVFKIFNKKKNPNLLKKGNQLEMLKKEEKKIQVKIPIITYLTRIPPYTNPPLDQEKPNLREVKVEKINRLYNNQKNKKIKMKQQKLILRLKYKTNKMKIQQIII